MANIVNFSDTISLYDVINFQGKQWITSQKFHHDTKAYSSVSNTNKAIRNMETYDKLLADEHIMEITYNCVKELEKDTEPELVSVFNISCYFNYLNERDSEGIVLEKFSCFNDIFYFLADRNFLFDIWLIDKLFTRVGSNYGG